MFFWVKEGFIIIESVFQKEKKNTENKNQIYKKPNTQKKKSAGPAFLRLTFFVPHITFLLLLLLFLLLHIFVVLSKHTLSSPISSLFPNTNNFQSFVFVSNVHSSKFHCFFLVNVLTWLFFQLGFHSLVFLVSKTCSWRRSGFDFDVIILSSSFGGLHVNFFSLNLFVVWVIAKDYGNFLTFLSGCLRKLGFF